MVRTGKEGRKKMDGYVQSKEKRAPTMGKWGVCGMRRQCGRKRWSGDGHRKPRHSIRKDEERRKGVARDVGL